MAAFFSFAASKHYVIDVESSMMHCKIQNYIHLFLFMSWGMQYISESVTNSF